MPCAVEGTWVFVALEFIAVHNCLLIDDHCPYCRVLDGSLVVVYLGALNSTDIHI